MAPTFPVIIPIMGLGKLFIPDMLFAHPLIPLVLDLTSSDPGVRLRAVGEIARQLAVPGFLDTLRQHRLTAFYYHCLTRLSREEVGEIPRLEDLRWDYLAQMRRCQTQTGEVRSLVGGLQAGGVEPLVLKGGDVRHRLYDDPATRPMGDVDLLIAPAELGRVRALLASRGFVRVPRDMDRGPDFNARFAWEEAYASPQRGALVLDLHWDIRKMGAFYRLPYTALKARAVVRDMGGVTALALCPEHLLMNLCLNALEELEEAGILKILDIHLALSRLPLDWDFFLTETASLGIQGPMAWMLQEMAKLRPGAMPALVLRQLEAYIPPWWERVILRRGAGSFLVGFLAAMWRYLPVRKWPALVKGKIWPSAAFIQGNARDYRSRRDYVLHLLKRSRAKT
jgi:hypothetical protein